MARHKNFYRARLGFVNFEGLRMVQMSAVATNNVLNDPLEERQLADGPL
jgi:hypothetical protein